MHSLHRFVRYCTAVTALVAAGCAAPVSGTNSPAIPSASTHAAFGHAWMQPQAARSNLAYVADYESNALFVFTYKQNAMIFSGYIPLGSSPVAECVDKAQDVWVVTSSHLLLEFAHGGTTPIGSIGAPALFANGCSVDAATGNLAVAGADFNTGTVGAVFLYKKAKGQPVIIGDPAYELSDCAYDGKGNLYADRDVNNTDLSLDVLPKGAKTFDIETTNQEFRRPGGLQWAKPYLVVGDSDNNVAYRFNVGSSIKLADTITFNQSTMIGFFAILRNRIVVPRTSVDAPQQPADGQSSGLLNTYAYPAGGNRIRNISDMSYPVAVAISLGPKGTSQ
jgi:hypothetical protein